MAVCHLNTSVAHVSQYLRPFPVMFLRSLAAEK